MTAQGVSLPIFKEAHRGRQDHQPSCRDDEAYDDSYTDPSGFNPFTDLPPISRRRWIHPRSLPTQMCITALDLDTTKNCNLRCTYCFKGETVHPGAKRMSLEIAMAAIDWLIEASMDANELWVNLMGGEPLLAWSTMQLVVPYAKIRAGRAGKTVQFGTTTNLTLVNEEIVDFADRWGMGWHCSIDGTAKVQDTQRPGVGGKPTSSRAERGVPHILKYRPGACARATVTPEMADTLFESLMHFQELGFREFAFAVADETRWQQPHFDAWDRQWALIADHVLRRYRDRDPISVAAIDYLIENHLKGPDHQERYSCGAGRGMVLVDHVGDIWPCHRWDGADHDSGSGGAWRFGNIFRPGFNERLHTALLHRDRFACYKPACVDCALERLCAGGCPASNLVTTGSIYWQDFATCETLRIIHRYALTVHDTLKAEDNRLFMDKFYKKPAESTAKSNDSTTKPEESIVKLEDSTEPHADPLSLEGRGPG